MLSSNFNGLFILQHIIVNTLFILIIGERVTSTMHAARFFAGDIRSSCFSSTLQCTDDCVLKCNLHFLPEPYVLDSVFAWEQVVRTLGPDAISLTH